MPSFRFRPRREPKLPVLGQETGQSAKENRKEADRLIEVIMGDGFEPTRWEQGLLDSCRGGGVVTGKMLFKLRNIRDRKYLRG